MVTAIVGDVKAAEIIPIIDKYFGRLPKGEKPEPLRTLEPPQTAETRASRCASRRSRSTSRAITSRRPLHPDDAAYDAIAEILGRGRTSRLYTLAGRDKKLAVRRRAAAGLPGVKYPHLFVAARGAGSRRQQRQGGRGAARPSSSG